MTIVIKGLDFVYMIQSTKSAMNMSFEINMKYLFNLQPHINCHLDKNVLHIKHMLSRLRATAANRYH